MGIWPFQNFRARHTDFKGHFESDFPQAEVIQAPSFAPKKSVWIPVKCMSFKNIYYNQFKVIVLVKIAKT